MTPPVRRRSRVLIPWRRTASLSTGQIRPMVNNKVVLFLASRRSRAQRLIPTQPLLLQQQLQQPHPERQLHRTVQLQPLVQQHRRAPQLQLHQETTLKPWRRTLRRPWVYAPRGTRSSSLERLNTFTVWDQLEEASPRCTLDWAIRAAAPTMEIARST